MISIITGSLIISLLHAIIPNHWLPIIAIGKKEKWTLGEVIGVTFTCAIAHGLSTISIGILLGYLGSKLSEHVLSFTSLIAPVILICIGIIFIYRHHKHKHFHIGDEVKQKKSKTAIVAALVTAMFFSPCMEIEAYFLLAGSHTQWLIWLIALLYLVITTTGMVVLVWFAYRRVLKMNWHTLEHNAGIITGATLVLTGIISFFV